MDPRPGYRRGAPPYLGPPQTHLEPLHYGTTYSSVKDSSSWILWQGHENLPHNNKQGRLWSALLAFAVFIVILIVLAIVALAIYMGAMRLDTGKFLIFDGSLRVTYGDHYSSKLANHSSNEFKEKSNKYKLMVENLYGRSELGPAVRYCSINGFANGSLVVFFRLILDRRKIPKKLTNVEDTAKMIIQEEANSLKPVALKNIRVDPKQIFIKRNMEQAIPHMSEEPETLKRTNITTEVINGVIRKAQVLSTSSPMTRDNNKKQKPDNVVKGSYKITTNTEMDFSNGNISEGNFVHSVGDSTVLPVEGTKQYTPSKSQSTRSKYTSISRQKPSKKEETSTVTLSSTTPVTEVMKTYNTQHSPGLTALISQKKDQDKRKDAVTSSTPAYDLQKEEIINQEPDLITLLPYILPVSEEPWKPILPDNFTRHPQRRPTVTEEYSHNSGVGVAEVILDPSDDSVHDHSEPTTDYLNSRKRFSSSSMALGQKTYDRYRHEGPRSNDQVSKFELHITSDETSLREATVLHTGSGDIIRKPDHADSLVSDAENLTSSSSSVFPFPDYATVKRFHNLDTFLKSYNDKVPKNDHGKTGNTGRSSNGKFNVGHLNQSSLNDNKSLKSSKLTELPNESLLSQEFKSSELPIVTLIPVRSNLGLGLPLRPRPKVHDDNNQSNPISSSLETKQIVHITESPMKITFDELNTETEPVPTTTETTMIDVFNSDTYETILPTDMTESEESDDTTITPDILEDTTVITDMFTTITESDESNKFTDFVSSESNRKNTIRQPKMSVESYNRSNQIELLEYQNLKIFDEKNPGNLLTKSDNNSTKNNSVKSDHNNVTPRNSYNVQVINDKIFHNSTLPFNIILTALTPSASNKTDIRNISSKGNSTQSNTIVDNTIKNADLINSNIKTIDFDSLHVLLGNHTIFPSSYNNTTSQKNHSKNILNNEAFRYLISQNYTKDKKIKSPGEEETAKSISLSYTVNNAGLSILTKTYNKVQSTKDIEKEKTVSSSSQNLTDCKNSTSFQCKSGECVSIMSRCNQLVDCSDGSDEKNCSCVEFLQAQFLTRKICDGVIDCWDFSDENNCDWCTPGQYVCTDSRICINQNQLCDGIQDCPMGDDERHCVTVAPSVEQAKDMVYYSKGYLMVRKEGEWGKLCLQNLKNVTSFKTNWTIPDVGREICRSMTYSDFEEIRKKQDPEDNQTKYFELSHLQDEIDVSVYSRPNLNFSRTECPRKEVVQIACKDLECGMRPQANTKWNSNSTSSARRGLRHSRIVGGGNASPGSWPWQAALYKEGEFQCGATLISERWLLSAGHCFYHALEDYWVARLGALRRGTNIPSPYEQLRPVSRILLHPGYIDTGFINDISLLQMKTPVKFTNYVRPICLPSPNTPIKDGSMCTVVGWGQLFEVGRIFPDTLQEVQLPVISTSECRKRTLFLPLYRVTENMLCAGYDRGGRDACLGDSGGPLMCQETDGRWSLLGVTSNGYGCARANRPGVYTKVSNYLSWVHSNLANTETTLQQNHAVCNGHRCPLGECLPLARVCNGYMECSDGSDEKNCW